MSTLVVTTLRDRVSTKELGAERIVEGVAKVWAGVQQSGAQAILDSFNVTSVSDGGTGITDVNITNAFSSTAYSAVGSGTNPHAALQVLTAGSFRISNTASNNSASDVNCGVAAFGDLAV